VRTTIHALAMVAALVAGGARPVAAETRIAPQRIVSLNLCTDQLLVMLVERRRIAALSFLASDPTLSLVSDEARSLPAVRGSAEEVLRHDPDLVLAVPFAARTTIDMLNRLGRRVVLLPLARDLAGIGTIVRQLAAAVGEEEAGERMVAAYERSLAAFPSRPEAGRPAALVYNIAGLVSGKGSLADAVLERAGWRNLAAELANDPRGAVPLELLVTHPPDLLVLGQDAGLYRTVQADNLRHPALRRLTERVPSLTLPQSHTLCGTPRVTQAIAMLAEARRSLQGGASPRPRP
jgi:iron complex transport system substrate-binding protein